MADAVAAVDPRQLGKILLIQTTAHAMTTPQALADFVCRGLVGLPGAGAVAVNIGDVQRGDFPVGSPAGKGLDGNENPLEPEGSPRQVLSIPIGTLHRRYGAIVIRSGNIEELAPYEPFLGSLANTIALTLENRDHANSLERLNSDLLRSKEGLESVVRERTSELVSINAALAAQIEERTRSAQQLRESELKYRDLFENASDAILLLDTDLNYLDVNRKAVEIFGFSRDEFLQRNFRDLDPSTAPSRETPAAQDGPIARDALRFFHQQRTRDGRLLDVEIGSSPVVNDGGVIGYRHIVRDVTAQRELERALRQSQKMEAIGTLASGIAHDFNNILTAIICSSELAQEQLPADTPASLDLKRIRDAGNRAADLVKQILAFSRPASDERKPLLLQPIIKESLKFLRASIPTTIEIVQDLAPATPMVLGDATQIHQVIMNLCTNAYHAMLDAGGILKVSLRFADAESISFGDKSSPDHCGYVMLEVSDTGCGIEPDVLDRIFDPYFTTKEKGRGTGLGLSVVHGIVKSLDGHIRVSSEPGVGSVFQVYLPAVQTAAVHAERREVRSLQRGSERIWVVDDELPLALIEKSMLENLGYKVRCFTSGAELLAALGVSPGECDLVMSDIGMPSMDGAQLARQILLVRPQMPIILCTGFSNSVTRADALAMGVRDYITKPLDFERISTVVRRTLDGAAAN